jgi:hypothetical protein
VLVKLGDRIRRILLNDVPDEDDGAGANAIMGVDRVSVRAFAGRWLSGSRIIEVAPTSPAARRNRKWQTHVSLFDRFPQRPGVPAVALAGGVLFACIPLTPAMGLVGVPEVPTDIATADAVVAAPVADHRSPVTVMAAAEAQREVLAAQEAAQRALELKRAEEQAALLTAGGGTVDNGPQVTTGGPIPTTDVTGKTRQIQALVRKYFPSDQLGNAMAVSACESGHSDAKGAVNSDGTIDWGVFQLNDGGTLQGALDAIGVPYSSTAEAQQLALKTETNVEAAAQIYAAQGWAPWVCAYKIGVVAGLYSNTPGPMDGKFDEWGKPTVSVPVITVDPGANNDPVPPTPQPKPTRKPGRTSDENPTPTPTPSKSATQRPSADPSRSPVPEPVPVAPVPPDPSTSPAVPPQLQTPAQSQTPQPDGNTPSAAS